MNEEKQLATLVGLDLILSPEHYKEITKLQQENKQLKEQINEYQKAIDETTSEKMDLEHENNQLKEELDLQFKDLMKRIQENNDEYLEEKNKLIKENHHLKSILTKLENLHKDMTIEIPGYYVYDKIQELRNKYE